MHLVLHTIRENWVHVIKRTCETTGSGLKVSSENAGLDIPCPMSIRIPKGTTGFKIHLGVKIKSDKHFLIVPRSSLSKTTLRMSNSVGVIDKGYRGELVFVVDNLKPIPVNVLKGQRLCQIIAPSLEQITFEFGSVTADTTRGENGFGSTD